MNKKKFDLEEIKRSIAEKYSWGPSADWTNFHFKELSKAIEDVTGDRLSEETLKRIFGKRKATSKNYQPQAFSQMVLVKFVESFSPVSQEREETQQVRKKLILIGLTLVTAVVIVFLILQVGHPFKKKPVYLFSSDNAIDYYPFTATFNYDVSEIKDSVFADYGRGHTTYLPPERSMINYFYSNTGVYQVRFYTRELLLDSLKVVAYANDWQGGYFPNSNPQLFMPFQDQSLYRQADHFYAPPDLLESEGIDLKEKIWTTYKLFSPFDKSLDALTLKTKVLNNASTGSFSCYDIQITLVGDSGLINYKFTQTKCFRYASLRISEKYLDGKFNDLSALSVDLSDWLSVKMTTSNGQFQIALENKIIFSETYKKSLGNLQGIVYSFFGSGKIDYLELREVDEEPFYQSTFSSNTD